MKSHVISKILNKKLKDMKVIDIIKKAQNEGTTRFAFELLPPLKGDDISTLFSTVDTLIKHDPAYINVTYHREDVKYVEREDGLLEKRIVSKRPGTVSISAALTAKYGLPVVPHIICGGFSKYDTEDALIDLNFLGIHNILALRGDNLKNENSFSPTKNGHSYATELVSQIKDMNSGLYLDKEVINSKPTDFSIGVAGYPEKHSESANPEMDIEFLKQKIDAGAEYIITQMFFDNNKFFDYCERCQKAGINVPIIPGIKPFSTKKQLSMLPQIFHVDIPQELAQMVLKSESNKDVYKIGIEWAIKQCDELKAAKVPVLHFYTMGKPDNIDKIATTILK